MFVVVARRCCIVALSAVFRMIRLTSRRRLTVAVMLAVTLAVLVFAVGKPFFLAPRYAVFGVDRHPSVLRLLESDVRITRLRYDEDDHDESDNEKTSETVGLFLVINPSTPGQIVLQSEIANNLPMCLPSYRYQIFAVTSATTESSGPFSRTLEDRKQHSGDDVKTAARQLRRKCIEAGSTSVIVWQVDVSGSVAPAVVADLVTEAYVDNITWYDVIFFPRITSPFPVWGRWPPTELALPSYVGAAVIIDDMRVRVAFHRTHLEIFGDSWPYWIQTGTEVARYLKDVYADSLSPPSTLDGAVREHRAWLRRQVSTPPVYCNNNDHHDCVYGAAIISLH